ncbi:hypothetical protein FRC02_009325 [Tulasnella sp. 418]|nr:hypothetical protein FRC02_009325 [Tulasnella sp. 418]
MDASFLANESEQPDRYIEGSPDTEQRETKEQKQEYAPETQGSDDNNVVAVAAPAPEVDELASSSGSQKLQVIKPNNSKIFYHGRWDEFRGTWWPGSGFKLHVSGLTSLSLSIGTEHTTQPYALVGVSIDYEPFKTYNISGGLNIILPESGAQQNGWKKKKSVVRLATEGWQNNRIELKSINLNKDADLLPYTPSKLSFQFIGDSLTAGQYNTQGVISSWGFLTGETFKAEHNIQAQPGACLTDQVCWGNAHGMSYQFFMTEDTGYYYTTDHNYTTPWNFKRDYPPTHVFIHIGANDNAYEITGDALAKTLLDLIEKLRKLYPKQPFFVLTPWGWPSADGNVYYYYDGVYKNVVDTRNAKGDKNVYLVDTTGWVGWDDVFHDNVHPNDIGHQHVAEKLTAWLIKWGLKPQAKWATLPSA